MKGIVYQTTNLINGKIYIGQHECSTDDFDGYLGSGTHLLRAIEKYGKENFKRETLRICETNHEMSVWEHYYIKLKKSQDPKIGYNIADGDVNTSQYNPSKRPEVREKIKKDIKRRGGLSGKNNPMYGKHWSEGKRNQMMQMFKNNPPMKGKKHSEETKKRWSEKRKGHHPLSNLSEDERKEFYNKMKGEGNPMYGSTFIWITDGNKNKRHNPNEPIPEGWIKGMTRKKK